MALPQGVNFRETSGFVTDGADEHPSVATAGNVVSSDTYPTTSAQGNDVGWEGVDGSSDHGTRDRNSGVDARFAGMHFMGSSAGNDDFRIDLPSTGDYLVRCAAGQMVYSGSVKLDLYDGTTLLRNLAETATTAGGNFRDATDVEHSNTDWPTNNNSVTETFSTTICRFRLGDGTSNAVLAHVYIEAAAGGGGATIPIFAHHYRQMMAG